jgi:hypothetical protein
MLTCEPPALGSSLVSRHRGPVSPADLRSANGERRAEPPRREFHEALLEAGSFEDLPGKWQAAILSARSAGVVVKTSRPTAKSTPDPDR